MSLTLFFIANFILYWRKISTNSNWYVLRCLNSRLQNNSCRLYRKLDLILCHFMSLTQCAYVFHTEATCFEQTTQSLGPNFMVCWFYKYFITIRGIFPNHLHTFEISSSENVFLFAHFRVCFAGGDFLFSHTVHSVHSVFLLWHCICLTFFIRKFFHFIFFLE